MRRSILCVLVVVALSILCQCSWLMSTKIADIRNNARRYADKEVTVSGTVTSELLPRRGQVLYARRRHR